jgi:hypothetical protein
MQNRKQRRESSVNKGEGEKAELVWRGRMKEGSREEKGLLIK